MYNYVLGLGHPSLVSIKDNAGLSLLGKSSKSWKVGYQLAALVIGPLPRQGRIMHCS